MTITLNTEKYCKKYHTSKAKNIIEYFIFCNEKESYQLLTSDFLKHVLEKDSLEILAKSLKSTTDGVHFLPSLML